jgi:hypothetical protein
MSIATVYYNGQELTFVQNGFGKLGIDQLKELVLFTTRIYKRAVEIAEDKKVSLWEALGSIGLVIEAGRFLGKVQDIVAEIKDLTHIEFLEVCKFVADSYTLPFSEGAEDFIQKVIFKFIEGAAAIIEGYVNAKPFFKNV